MAGYGGVTGTVPVALSDVRQAGQPHYVADGPGNPPRRGDHARQQDEAETAREVYVASEPPLDAPDSLNYCEERVLLRGRCAHPGINSLLEADAVHSIEGTVECERRNRRSGGEAVYHPPDSGVDVQSEVQRQNPENEDRRARKLGRVDEYPGSRMGISGEPTFYRCCSLPGMEVLCHLIENLPGYQQNRREEEQLALNHDEPPVGNPMKYSGS